MSILDNDLERLNFEDFIWCIFIGLGILNIIGDNFQKKYLMKNYKNDEVVANKIFLFALGVSFLIYIYFLVRNINAYKKANEEEKSLLGIKVFGSIFFIVGIICLIYFQYKQTDFIGTPL